MFTYFQMIHKNLVKQQQFSVKQVVLIDILFKE